MISLILSSSGMLLSLGWFRTDVSGLRIVPIFKGQDVKEEGPGYWTTWVYKGEEWAELGIMHSEKAKLASKSREVYGQQVL